MSIMHEEIMEVSVMPVCKTRGFILCPQLHMGHPCDHHFDVVVAVFLEKVRCVHYS